MYLARRFAMAQSAIQAEEGSTAIESEKRWLDLARSILNRVLFTQPATDYTVRLWNGEEIGRSSGTAPRFTLAINRPSALRHMFWPPDDLAIGEAYLSGDFDIEGDILAAVALGDSIVVPRRSLAEWASLARDLFALPEEAPALTAGRQRARLSGRKHSLERDRQAIRFHYDVGNDFYSLWLDQRLVYSCAYFRTGSESIDAAQEAKLDIICRKLDLQPGERLLDIGCGWGGLVIYAAERYGVSALGVTLSEQQHALANERIRAAGLQDRARVELLDYRQLEPAAYDKIVSVGMFEHVGRAKLPEYFAQAYRLLKPKGLFLNHGIAAGKAAIPSWPLRLARAASRRATFSERYIFPDGELVPIQDALGFAAAAGFEIRDVDGWREHYARTLRHWLARLEEHETEARRLTDERTYRTWRLFLAASAHGFDTGSTNVYQTLLAKPDQSGSSGMPLTREAWYSDGSECQH
jgi:cyclopropane-fatty-acyl-phospholipid synthase